MFASAFDVFDAFHSPLHRGFYHRPAKRHRRAHSPYAAHLHPFYHIENLARIALDADTLARTDAFDPEVRETDRGYFITALVPGVAAEDIAVTAARADESSGEADRLLVRSASRPHVRADLRLPPGGAVDADNITASCIDGVFRVVVPKTKPARAEVPVAGGAGPARAAGRPRLPPGRARIRRARPAGHRRASQARRGDRVFENVHEKRRFLRPPRGPAPVVSARCADGALTSSSRRAAAGRRRARVRQAPARAAPTPRRSARTRSPCCAARCPGARRRTSRWSPRAPQKTRDLRVSAGADRAGQRSRRVRRSPRLDLRSLKAFVVDGVLTVTRPRLRPRGQDRRGARTRPRRSRRRVPSRRGRRRTQKAEKANEPGLPRRRSARRRRAPSSRRRRDAVTSSKR